jgi:hypothetical protein
VEILSSPMWPTFRRRPAEDRQAAIYRFLAGIA